jgi:hypothetical protein
VAVSIINYSFGQLFHIKGLVCYHCYEAILLTIVIITLLFPIIIWGTRYTPIIIGKKSIKIL